ncbi:hypothetical protein FH972_026601 [Carpinus fangiana]|uniref:Uncharacterized protein n=1 Tax=Carpinus fangiana TaxID=176857 RepID=A0A5N6L4G5_9ROSI|nr:hypothetical protein FH972_026601 [Carpinus fangiana]
MSDLATLYNSLRPVEDVTAQLKANPGVLDDLAKLLVSNNLHKDYDIRLVHKHFDIDEDERVVSFDGDNCKVSTPFNSQGTLPADVVEEHSINIGEGQVFASDFLVNEIGMIPYEFGYSPKAPRQVPLGDNFVRDWTATLRARGMDGVLGLALQDGVAIGGYEESDPDARWSKVSYEDAPPGDGTIGYLTTSWRINNPEGGLIELKQCSYCSSLGKHGKTTACTKRYFHSIISTRRSKLQSVRTCSQGVSSSSFASAWVGKVNEVEQSNTRNDRNFIEIMPSLCHVRTRLRTNNFWRIIRIVELGPTNLSHETYTEEFEVDLRAATMVLDATSKGHSGHRRYWTASILGSSCRKHKRRREALIRHVCRGVAFTADCAPGRNADPSSQLSTPPRLPLMHRTFSCRLIRGPGAYFIQAAAGHNIPAAIIFKASMNIDKPSENSVVPGTNHKPVGRARHGVHNIHVHQIHILSKLPNWIKGHLVAFIGEFVGTFMFLFLAFSSTQVANYTTAGASLSTAPNTSNLLFVALAFGFSLAVNAWVFFRITGGLFNPAVTLGMCLIGSLPWARGGVVMLAQLTGATASAGIVSALFPGEMAVGTTLGGGATPVEGLFIEMFLTAELVFAIFMMAADKNEATFIAPIGIGLALFVSELPGIFFTGGSLNPARSFGPAAVNHDFPHYHWIYWVGPFLGTLVATAFYKLVKGLEHENKAEAEAGQQKREGRAKRDEGHDLEAGSRRDEHYTHAPAAPVA